MDKLEVPSSESRFGSSATLNLIYLVGSVANCTSTSPSQFTLQAVYTSGTRTRVTGCLSSTLQVRLEENCNLLSAYPYFTAEGELQADLAYNRRIVNVVKPPYQWGGLEIPLANW